nr:hypothetical protein [Tanacetum cinerariifolium]
KDYAKTVKNQSKPGNIRHEIESLHQKPDQRAVFYNNQANEAKCQKIEKLRVDNSIPNSENELSDNEASDFDDPSFPRPPLEPPDVEFDFEPNSGEEILAMMNIRNEK